MDVLDLIPEEDLIKKLQIIRNSLLDVEEQNQNLLDKVHINYRYNAKNFLRYLKFRTYDITGIQGDLTALGISSLSHAERHVLANIENILYLLTAHIGEHFIGKHPFGKHPINYKESANCLREHTTRLFGNHIDKQGIMVTLPSDGTSIDFLSGLLEAGMNIARINCSHDSVDVWKEMIGNLKEACKIQKRECSIYMDLAGPKLRIAEIKNKNLEFVNQLKVYQGDRILLVNDFNELPSHLNHEAIINCTIPEIIDDVLKGQSILFDDGKIEGRIENVSQNTVQIKILNTNPKGGKLKLEKGINLPETHLNLPSLTQDDINNLDFVCANADIVGFSFVRKLEDIDQLQKELKKRNRKDIGMVLKIENREAFQNLPYLLLKAMESPTIGVMTARGDLAVELGVERLSEVQEEIMWLCEAALIPNIWATQVLESLAKKGIASRAEITDAAMSVRTECIMLNKGPYIVKALKTLNAILSRMEKHQSKKQGTLRSLNVATEFWNKI